MVNFTGILFGTFGNDWLLGNSANNWIFAWDGHDTIRGGNGSDLIYGGNGNDYIDGGNGNDYVYGGNGVDKIYGGYGNDKLYGGDSWDTVYGEGGNDTLIDRNGYMHGGTGSDTLIADYSNSSYNGIYFGAEGQQIIQTQGSKILSFSAIETFEVTGTDDDDQFNVNVITGGESEFFGGEGNDTFYSDKRMGRYLNGALFGGNDDDTFIATEGYLDGGRDTDTLIADYTALSYDGRGIEFGYYSGGGGYEYGVRVMGHSPYNPLLTFQDIEIFEAIGTQHNDIFHSRGESSLYKGGAGNDTFIGEKGTFYGQSGDYDHLSSDFSNSYRYQSAMSIDLTEGEIRSGDNNQVLISHQGIETFEIIATQHNDTLTGSNGDDILQGHRGNDLIEGGAGNDILDSGYSSFNAGNDVLK
ncbi:MAG: hypothetical protein RI580_10910, partial [Halothece sp. Uz-M2-17]|nr:hypothetical protein [Halothece sp. Uz-M2-17]